jgi:FAD synthetase
MDKKVLVFGTYDLLHEGHKYFLKKASSYGSLFVVVARDKTVLKIKKAKPWNDENKRLEDLQSLSFVHLAMLGNLGNKYDIIEKINPDLIILGYDQVNFTEKLEEEIKKRNIKCEVLRLEAYKPNEFKSSIIKNRIKETFK